MGREFTATALQLGLCAIGIGCSIGRIAPKTVASS